MLRPNKATRRDWRLLSAGRSAPMRHGTEAGASSDRRQNSLQGRACRWSRADRIDADALRSIGDGRGFRQPDNGMLRHGIGRIRRRAAEPRQGRCVDDGAGALCEEMRNLGAEAVKRRIQAQLQIGIDDVERDFMDGKLRATDGAAHIVESAIETAERFECGRDHPLRGLGQCQIAFEGLCAAPRFFYFLRHPVCAGAIEIGNHHAGTRFREPKRSRLPDSRRAAGDECHLAREIHPSSSRACAFRPVAYSAAALKCPRPAASRPTASRKFRCM